MSKQKKISKNIKDKNPNGIIKEGNELEKLIKLVIAVSAVFIIFYGITSLLMKEDKTSYIKELETTGTIQYDEIVLSQLLNQNNQEYFVLVKDVKDLNVDLYNSYLDQYSGKENAIRIYDATLNNLFNSKYIGTETNTNISDINELKLKGSTLVKIENKKIVEVYDEKEEIINFLIELIK